MVEEGACVPRISLLTLLLTTKSSVVLTGIVFKGMTSLEMQFFCHLNCSSHTRKD